jgi:NMD protein affecting ribosome stability and mRNA decay
MELGNRRVRSGCCARCGKERDSVYKRYCKACVKESWSERRRREWVELGRCAGCGHEREDESSRFCVWCNEEREYGR